MAESRSASRYCFIVRHGERADHAPDTCAEYEGHPDAYLTPKGHQQAAETGEWLREELKKIEQNEGRPITKIELTCSPFERCISTCSKVAEALGISEISINYRYCELLVTFLYNANPMPHLSLRNTDLETLKSQKGWQGLTVTDSDEAGRDWAG